MGYVFRIGEGAQMMSAKKRAKYVRAVVAVIASILCFGLILSTLAWYL